MARKIKKKQSRKDLLKEPDELLTFTEQGREWFTENWPIALIAVGVFAVVFIVATLVKSSIAQSRERLQTQITEAMNTYARAQQSETMLPDPKEGPPPDPIKMYEDASYRFEKILRENPRAKQKEIMEYYLASAYLKMGKYGSAQENFKKIVDTAGKGDIADLARFNVGLCMFLQKKYDDALKIFREIVDSGTATERASALVYGGKCLEEEGKLDEAIKYYRLALDAYSDVAVTQGLDSRIERLKMQTGKKGENVVSPPPPVPSTPKTMTPEAQGQP